MTFLPHTLCSLTVPPSPGLGVTSLPGLIFWFVLPNTKLTLPLGPSLSLSPTPSLLFPSPCLVPFPAPRCVPRPRRFPRTGNPSPQFILLPLLRRLPPCMVSRLGLSGLNPPLSVLPFRVGPLVTLPLLTRLPHLSPLARSLVISPFHQYWCMSHRPRTLALLPPPPSVSSHHTIELFPLPYPPALATNTIHILLLALVDRALPLRLYDPRIELPRCRVLSLMARFLAAGLVHNCCLHYAPSLGAIITFSACLDRVFIGKSRFCGVPTVWQSIFGARVECIFRAKVLATSPNYCCLSRIFLCSAILCPHSRRSFLSLRPLQDPISQAKLEALFQVLRFLFWASSLSVSVLGLA